LEPDRLEEIRAFRTAVATAVSSTAFRLAYVTGRHLSLAIEGIGAYDLPRPDVLVCDVGTSVYVASDETRPSPDGVLGGTPYVRDDGYRMRMRAAFGPVRASELRDMLRDIDMLELQEPEKQAEFKISLYTPLDRMDEARGAVDALLRKLERSLKTIWSVDPITGQGLLDVLPQGVAKHTALAYLRERGGYDRDEVVYAGDSGNDFDALLSGHPSIVVANAANTLKETLREEGATRRMLDRIYFADRPYAAGVLEGCRHFGAL
jgi:hydroxymethylpyrimidine pyrophosphatase-like HAD family hydrolase